MTRILVIDTDAGERLILRSRLVEQGYDVTLADNGAKGLVQVRAEPFELVLLAAELTGGVDSAEVSRRLKAIPRLQSVPVIIYANGASSNETSDRAYDAGCDAFVPRGQMPALDRVLRVKLQAKARIEELMRENRGLSQENKKLVEERRREREQEAAQRLEGGGPSLLRELGAARPDGVVVVDSRGVALVVDRGACELFGTRIEGRTLGQIAPGSGLEAFVRDARTEAREQFRFDVRHGKGRADRSVLASVVPVTTTEGGDNEGLRVLLLVDSAKRRVTEEVLRAREQHVPSQQLSTLMEAARRVYSTEAIIGTSPPVAQLRRRIEEALRKDTPVLLRGERGTGKAFLANVLHYAGHATGSIHIVRPAALTPENLEHELFGYVEGAFEGAIADRPGWVVEADEGAIYVAEIAAMPLELQERLLNVLETGRVRRKGAKKAERARPRLIASTEKDLGVLVREGKFSAELYAKLVACAIDVPALREVQADLPLMVEHYLLRYGAPRGVRTVDGSVLTLAQQYEWPGNLAELEDAMEDACRRAEESGAIGIEHLPRALRDLDAGLDSMELVPQAPPQRAGLMAATPGMPNGDAAMRRIRPWDITDEDPISLDLYEKKALLRALENCGGDKLAAARLLKVGKSTLYRKLKRLGIS